MNTKQLSVLWYGVLAATLILLANSEVWSSLGAVALVTGALIYTLGPMHSASLGRVAGAVAAPFLLAGLVLAGLFGYRAWQDAAAADALIVEDVQVTEKPDCSTQVDSTELSRLGGQRTDEPLVARAVQHANQLSEPCHLIHGTLQNGSNHRIEDVTITAFVTDSTGHPEMATVQASYLSEGETSFEESVHLSSAVKAQPVDSVRVSEVSVSGSEWPF